MLLQDYVLEQGVLSIVAHHNDGAQLAGQFSMPYQPMVAPGDVSLPDPPKPKALPQEPVYQPMFAPGDVPLPPNPKAVNLQI